MTLLVFTPTWRDASGEVVIHPEVSAAIDEQTGVDFEWRVGTDNPYPIGEHRNVLHQYQQARAIFLDGRWEALVTIEHDNRLPDPDALRRLAETPGDVVYAPYLLRHGQHMLSTWQYINDRNLGMSLSNYRPELARARSDVVHRVSGTGFGCTLIRRRVLEALEFSGATERDQNWCPDLRFAQECLRKCFVANGRFDVPVLHWEGNGWLHPFQSRRNGVATYIALETMNALAAGRHVRLVKDLTIVLSDEEAAELSRLGVIQSAPGVAPLPAAPQPDPREGEVPIAPLQSEMDLDKVPPSRRNRARTLKKD